MRAFVTICCFALLLAGVAPAIARGETLVPAEHHEWARFRPGAWKHVRVKREDFDASGKTISTSVTETTTTLIAVSACSVTLRVDTIVEMGGRQFAKQPQLVTQGLGGETDGGSAPVKTGGMQSISVAGRQLDSEVRTATVRDNSCQWTSRVFYSKSVAPYVLRRVTSSTDTINDAAKYETTVDVIAIDKPIDVKGVVKKASQIRTVHTTPKSKTVTLEYRCEDVPGGYVSHTSEQTDSEGHVVGRSTLELIDYQIPSATDGPARVEYRQVWPRWYYRRWGR